VECGADRLLITGILFKMFITLTQSPDRLWQRMKGLTVHPIRGALHLGRNALRACLGRADFKRWSSPQGLESWWDERTQMLARLVPAGSRVIEFGAGRRQLEKYLSADCTYIPSDLTDRGPGTIVCDLNKRPLPDLSDQAPTVAVFGGVLEYVKDVKSLIAWLAETGVHTFVLSFDAMPAGLTLYGALKERRRRLHFGYMNSLTGAEVKALFSAVGMRCVVERRWTTQCVYRFARKPMDERTGPLKSSNSRPFV